MKLACCSAIGCTNRHSKGFMMKSFPRDPWRRKLWVEKIKRKNWTATRYSYLCEIHFAPEMWALNKKNGKKILKRTAIPTIFHDVPPEKVQKPLSKLKAVIKEPEKHKVDDMLNERSFFVESKEAATSVPVSIQLTDINRMNKIPSVTIKEEPIVSSAEMNEVNNMMIKQEENGTYIKESLNKNESNSKAENLICRYCNYEADGAISLRVHILSVHSNEKEHKCPMCNYTSKYQYTISAHVNCRHMNKKPFKCTMCSYSSAKKYALQLHINAKHTRDRPFKCNICTDRSVPPSYCTSVSWKRHMMLKHNTNYYIR